MTTQTDLRPLPRFIIRYFASRDIYFRNTVDGWDLPILNNLKDKMLDIIFKRSKVNIVKLDIHPNEAEITLYCDSKVMLPPQAYIELKQLKERYHMRFHYAYANNKWQQYYEHPQIVSTWLRAEPFTVFTAITVIVGISLLLWAGIIYLIRVLI